MQQTEDGDRRASLADLLAIETLRILEKDQPRFLPSVDIPLASRLAPRALEDPVTAEHAMTNRAKEVLTREYGLANGVIVSALKLAQYGLLAFVILVTISAFGMCNHFLLFRDADKPVDVLGFASFLWLDLIMAIPPVLLMITALVPHNHNRRRSTKGQIAVVLEDIGQMMSAVYWVLRVFVAKASPKAAEQSDRSAGAARAASVAAGSMVLRAVALTSNLCWTIAIGIVLASFLFSAFFREYDFTWESTLLNPQGKLIALQYFVKPLSLFHLCQVPDKALADYLSESNSASEATSSEVRENQKLAHAMTMAMPLQINDFPLSQAAAGPAARLSENDRLNERVKQRSKCAKIMAALLFFYGLIPRALLLMIAVLQFRGTKENLRPSLTAPYFSTIINYLRAPPIGPSSDVAEPTSEPLTAVVQPSADNPLPTHEAPPPGPPSTSRWFVFSYEVSAPKEGWIKELNLTDARNGCDLGDANDRILRQKVIKQLCQDARNITSLTIIVDLTSVPDRPFTSFLKDTLQPLAYAAQAETVALLSGGERLRAKFSDDADHIRTRTLLWRQKIVECGICEANVLEFDHQSATAQSRDALLARLRTIRTASADTGHSQLAIQLGGRFPQARKLIYTAVQSLAGSTDPDRLGAKTNELHQQIHDLYEQAPTLFARTFAQVIEKTPSLGAALEVASTKASAVVTKSLQSAKQLGQTLSQIVEYLSGLDTRWAFGVGVAGALAAGGAAFLSAPVTLGGAGIATLLATATGAHVPMLVQKLSRVLRGKNQNMGVPSASEPTADDFCLDDLVRAAVAWTIVLELQGNPEHVITTTLKRVLTGCHPNIVASPDESNELLDEVDRRLRQLPASTPS